MFCTLYYLKKTHTKLMLFSIHNPNILNCIQMSHPNHFPGLPWPARTPLVVFHLPHKSLFNHNNTWWRDQHQDLGPGQMSNRKLVLLDQRNKEDLGNLLFLDTRVHCSTEVVRLCCLGVENNIAMMFVICVREQVRWWLPAIANLLALMMIAYYWALIFVF